MATASQGNVINHGLAFLGLLSFIASFSVSRIFTTLYPHTWVVIGGIHIHHFWYGLVMVTVAGWLGIISLSPIHRRLYALVFGLGAGLIGDEVGLLLTLGNYHSELTYVFVVSFVVVALLTLLLSGYRDKLKDDVIGIGTNERLVHIGVIIAGLSVAAFSVNALLEGSIILIIGVALVAAGTRLRPNRQGG